MQELPSLTATMLAMGGPGTPMLHQLRRQSHQGPLQLGSPRAMRLCWTSCLPAGRLHHPLDPAQTKPHKRCMGCPWRSHGAD